MPTMKPRQAAAIALVGWYLMMPPRPAGPRMAGALAGWPDTNAPLSKWIIDKSFDSAEDCERGFRKLVAEVMTAQDNESAAQEHQSLDAVCIATNDPRLAK
jgi:hypothetical protein